MMQMAADICTVRNSMSFFINNKFADAASPTKFHITEMYTPARPLMKSRIGWPRTRFSMPWPDVWLTLAYYVAC